MLKPKLRRHSRDCLALVSTCKRLPRAIVAGYCCELMIQIITKCHDPSFSWESTKRARRVCRAKSGGELRFLRSHFLPSLSFLYSRVVFISFYLLPHFTCRSVLCYEIKFRPRLHPRSYLARFSIRPVRSSGLLLLTCPSELNLLEITNGGR